MEETGQHIAAAPACWWETAYELPIGGKSQHKGAPTRQEESYKRNKAAIKKEEGISVKRLFSHRTTHCFQKTSMSEISATDGASPRRKKPIGAQSRRIYLNLRPIVIQYTPATYQLFVEACQRDLARPDILSQSKTAILACLSEITPKVHPHRIIYCATAEIFKPSAPLPFGGPRTTPGYTSFNGQTCNQLFDFLVSLAYNTFWNRYGRDSIDFIIGRLNYVIALHRCVGGGSRRVAKQTMDELLLQGMKKAGHIPWSKAAIIPEQLRDDACLDDFGDGVFFSPKHLGTGTGHNPIEAVRDQEASVALSTILQEDQMLNVGPG
ncbi:hypothetical protein BDR26DRAFT_916075 [Obelidium mucronatum]|nr:hypothetical protein BDR26DRAFT_916075 [Obelidium mucronatum]